MNFEIIEEFVKRYKKYLIFVVGIIAIFLVIKNGEHDSENSSNIVGQEQSIKKSSEQSSSMSNASSSQADSPKEITCDISGAVNDEGVYTLENGARLNELIKAAGGLRKNAQIKAINRAMILKDQVKIHIPFKGEKVDSSMMTNANQSPSASENGQTESSGDKINLNQATSADLQKLNGIGEKKAEQIIAYRKQKGEFKKVEDLMQVSGIGEKTFAALKDKITV